MFILQYKLVARSAALRRSVATAVSSSKGFGIPVVDFGKFQQTDSIVKRRAVANEIVSSFKESGFVYLSNHGIPQATIRNAFLKSKEFFSLSPEIKAKLAWEDPRANRGYVQIGRERVTQSDNAEEIASLREQAPDYKESMEIGREWDSKWKNQWPQESDVPGFKQSMLGFFQTCHDLHVEVMRSIALGLNLKEDFFDDKIQERCHNLRLLSYPPVKRSILVNDGQTRAGAHSDYGTLTLLFQDSVGGLEVQNPNTGEFIAATPVPDTIVVNAGDLLSRWSNDVLRSTLHRVVSPPTTHLGPDEFTPVRQSIAFFCNPNFNVEVSCLPNCGSPAKYPSVNAGAYIVGRLSATYT